MRRHEAVADVAVIGVADERAGELPRAFIVKKQQSGATEQDLIDFVRQHSAPHKHLKGGVFFIEAIPKTATGKILRRLLKDYSSV